MIEAYPGLFRPPAGTLEGAEGSPECGEGWRDLLDRACIRIRAVLQAHGGSFKFTQVKEKYGTARLYWEGSLSEEAEEKLDEAIDLAQARSACTCEQCGKPGRLFNRGGWLATACAEHARGELAPIKPGYENLHLVRTFGPKHERLPIVSCRRYIRETDSFVDVDPKSLGIEEE